MHPPESPEQLTAGFSWVINEALHKSRMRSIPCQPVTPLVTPHPTDQLPRETPKRVQHAGPQPEVCWEAPEKAAKAGGSVGATASPLGHG